MSSTFNGNLDIIWENHCLSKGVRCAMKLHSDALSGKEINIRNQNQTSSSSSIDDIDQTVDNGSSLTYWIFWKKDAKCSESSHLPSCCEDCGSECIEFRCPSIKFSKDGRCQVPITLWCSPTHNKRPKTTLLILRIEIIHNDIRVQGEVPIIFKKHVRSQPSVDNEQKIMLQLQQQIELVNKTLQNINELVGSLPEHRTIELESLQRCAELLLEEAEKTNLKKRKVSEEEVEQQPRQQPQTQLYQQQPQPQLYQQSQQSFQPYPYQQQQPQQSLQVNYVNTATTPNPTFVPYPVEMPYTTTLPTYPSYMAYTPSVQETTKATNAIFRAPSPFGFEINPLYPPPPFIPLDGFPFQK